MSSHRDELQRIVNHLERRVAELQNLLGVLEVERKQDQLELQKMREQL